MLAAKSPWSCPSLSSADTIAIATLVQSLQLHPLIAKILIRRGISDPGSAGQFLQPRLADLQTPWDLADFSRAVRRLVEAVERSETITVFGDYDVDGICSAAIVYGYLLSMGASVNVQVAVRDEGYGVSAAQVQRVIKQQARVIVLTDCGTNEIEPIAAMTAAGIDVITLDHHRVECHKWPGYALVNPHRPDCAFSDKTPCSAALAFYLAAGLRREFTSRGRSVADPKEWLDLAALATIADVAALQRNNRIIVARGLEQIGRTQRPGLRALMQLGNVVDPSVTTEDVAWRLAPRINAAGRMGDANVALKCLSSDDVTEAKNAAQQCDVFNSERKQIQESVWQAAKLQAEQMMAKPTPPSFILVAGQHWHPGVIGIVASKLTESFMRPAAVVALEGDVGRGSARSVPGVDLFALLQQVEQHLQRFGGHAAAAGFSIATAKLDSLRVALDECVAASIGTAPMTSLQIDEEISLSDLSVALCERLTQLRPFGEGNPTPVFCARAVIVEQTRIVGANHLLLSVRQGTSQLSAIAFGQAQRAVAPSDRIDLAFVPEIDTFQTSRMAQGPRVRLRVIDMKATDA